MNPEPPAEWLETDGLGGFAMGSVDLIRRRRYHALLIAALQPPGERHALVKGLELWLEGPSGRIDLSSQRYRGGSCWRARPLRSTMPTAHASRARSRAS